MLELPALRSVERQVLQSAELGLAQAETVALVKALVVELQVSTCCFLAATLDPRKSHPPQEHQSQGHCQTLERLCCLPKREAPAL